METNNNTLQNWITELEKELKSSPLLDFSYDKVNSIRIMKDDFISLFNDAVNGKSMKMCKLDNFTNLSQAISLYQKDNELFGNELFTELSSDIQQEKLKLIKEESDNSLELTAQTNAYLCFGILKYNLDVFSNVYKQAPMIFIPVTLSYNEEKETYYFSGIKGEVYINKLLVERIKKVRRVDLSYPIDSNFSISEFLYYISIKIQALNWNLANHVVLANFDLFSYNDYLEIKERKDEILSHEIIKKISYFNSQFYNFNNKKEKPLDSKFLSILDIDNEEYPILKKVCARNNMIIKTSNQEAKIHLLSNTILSYVLNNKKVLIVYANEGEKEELLRYIDLQGYANYVTSLNPLSLDKQALLSDIVNYDNYLLPYNKAKTALVNDDIQEYYKYKNEYKKMVNSLRTIDNPLRTSLNKLINEYYRLDKYPLINISLNEPNRLTRDDLSRYIEYIIQFGNKINNLGCPIKEHPFYGFDKKTMVKDDYLKLKEATTKLSAILNDTNTIISVGVKKYGYPNPSNLKELKALLNILDFIDTYNYKIEWINNKNIKNDFLDLVEIRKTIEKLNKDKLNLIDKYTRKILFINEDIINEYRQTNSPKTKSKIRKLLGKQVSLSDVDPIVNEVEAYFNEVKAVKEKSANYDEDMVRMMRNNELNRLEACIKHIYSFRASLRYIKDKNEFDITKYVGNKNENRLITRKALQKAYNEVLTHSNLVKEYFNKDTINTETIDFVAYQMRMEKIAKAFSSINDYTDFYKSLIETNDFIPNLGNELVNAGKPQDFKYIFLKKFYYDVINERITSNKSLKENTRQNLYDALTNFASSDDKRKEMITNIISSNIDAYLKRNLLRLKLEEGDRVYQMFSKNPSIVTMNMICDNAKESLFNTKPCILVPYKSVSKYINDPLYKYDVLIALPRKDITMTEMLPSLVHSSSCIVFDEELISTDPRKNVTIDAYNLDNKFLTNARYAYSKSSYTKDTRNIIIHNSPLDAHVKTHIANNLVKHGFDVRVDYPIKTYILDILVKVPNTNNIVAIELNHLPYNSPEDTYDSFQLENRIIEELGFIPYRIFTSSYFFNEEMENIELIDFIIKKSSIIPQEKVKRKEVLLMDYLFKQYSDPRLIYYKFDKKKNSLEIILMEVINKCSPISIKELSNVVQVNIKPYLKKLVQSSYITIEDDFIYRVNAPIEFKRINRDENYYRPLKYVSKKEIYDAIYKIINHQKTIEQEVLIKMILLSLGYKKMSKETYETMINAIEFLLKEKIIFNNGTLLSSDVSTLQEIE